MSMIQEFKRFISFLFFDKKHKCGGSALRQHLSNLNPNTWTSEVNHVPHHGNRVIASGGSQTELLHMSVLSMAFAKSFRVGIGMF